MVHCASTETSVSRELLRPRHEVLERPYGLASCSELFEKRLNLSSAPGQARNQGDRRKEISDHAAAADVCLGRTTDDTTSVLRKRCLESYLMSVGHVGEPQFHLQLGRVLEFWISQESAVATSRQDLPSPAERKFPSSLKQTLTNNHSRAASFPFHHSHDEHKAYAGRPRRP